MISFIIPTKNEEKVIGKTLEEILLYSGKKEIIVSDGRSSDKTIEIAKKYADKVTVYEGEKRQKISEGRNTGASVASGDYVLFLDADMHIPDPDIFFKKALDVFKDDKVLALTVSLKVFPEMETRADRFVFSLVDYLYILQNNIFHTGASSGEFQMVRTDAFKKIGGFDERLAVSEDQDLFRRLAKIGRTRFEKSLVAYLTRRRAHTIGWPKLLFTWIINDISVRLLEKSVDSEWKEIR